MLSANSANFLIQKKNAVSRRLRLLKYRFLGMKINGDVHLNRISVPRNFNEIEINEGSFLDDWVVLIVSGQPLDGPKIKIGNCCGFNRFTIIDASLLVEFKDYARVGPHCYITDHNHGFAKGEVVCRQPLVEEKTIIGKDTWLGSHVTVLKGVEIGEGSIVGAGSVVTKDIPPYSIAVGSPAKVIRERT